MKPIVGNWYDYPEYYDIAFQADTSLEADFVVAASERHLAGRLRRILEPGCGTGRLVHELAARGYRVDGFDCNAKALAFANRRLRQSGLHRRARCTLGELAAVPTGAQYDAAYCFCNTFRSLTRQDEAHHHLRGMARALRPGGLYFLGLHLLPPDADWQACERWTEVRGGARVTITLRVLEGDASNSCETIRFSMRVHDGEKDFAVRSDETLRTYSARQFARMISSVPEFEIVAVHDFWYDLEHPVSLDDEVSDIVAILRRRPD